MQIHSINPMKMKFILGGLLSLLCLLSTSCRQLLNDFTFSYTVESVNNYKLVLTFNSDSTYQLEKYNYYMDNFERKRRPEIQKGRLTANEFESLKQKLEESKLFSMKDAYGFEENETRWSGSSAILHQVYIRADGKEKFVTCKESAKLPVSFIDLIQFVNTFLSEV